MAEAERRLREGDIVLLLATDAYGLGIDCAAISHVFIIGAVKSFFLFAQLVARNRNKPRRWTAIFTNTAMRDQADVLAKSAQGAAARSFAATVTASVWRAVTIARHHHPLLPTGSAAVDVQAATRLRDGLAARLLLEDMVLAVHVAPSTACVSSSAAPPPTGSAAAVSLHNQQSATAPDWDHERAGNRDMLVEQLVMNIEFAFHWVHHESCLLCTAAAAASPAPQTTMPRSHHATNVCPVLRAAAGCLQCGCRYHNANECMLMVLGVESMVCWRCQRSLMPGSGGGAVAVDDQAAAGGDDNTVNTTTTTTTNTTDRGSTVGHAPRGIMPGAVGRGATSHHAPDDDGAAMERRILAKSLGRNVHLVREGAFCSAPGKKNCIVGIKPCLVAAFYARLERQAVADEPLWQAVVRALRGRTMDGFLTAVERSAMDQAAALAAGDPTCTTTWARRLLAVLSVAPPDFVFRRAQVGGAGGHLGGLTPLALVVTTLFRMTLGPN